MRATRSRGASPRCRTSGARTGLDSATSEGRRGDALRPQRARQRQHQLLVEAPKPLFRTTEYLVNSALRQRNDEEITVGTGNNIGADPKIPPDEQAFAPGEIISSGVVGYPAREPRSGQIDVLSILGQLEAKQVSANRARRGRPHEQVSLEFLS